MKASQLLRLSVWALLFALCLVLVGSVLIRFPLGRVMGDDNLGMWLGVIVGGNVVSLLLASAMYSAGRALLASAAEPARPPLPPTRQPAASTPRRVYNAEAMR